MSSNHPQDGTAKIGATSHRDESRNSKKICYIFATC